MNIFNTFFLSAALITFSFSLPTESDISEVEFATLALAPPYTATVSDLQICKLSNRFKQFPHLGQIRDFVDYVCGFYRHSSDHYIVSNYVAIIWEYVRSVANKDSWPQPVNYQILVLRNVLDNVRADLLQSRVTGAAALFHVLLSDKRLATMVNSLQVADSLKQINFVNLEKMVKENSEIYFKSNELVQVLALVDKLIIKNVAYNQLATNAVDELEDANKPNQVDSKDSEEDKNRFDEEHLNKEMALSAGDVPRPVVQDKAEVEKIAENQKTQEGTPNDLEDAQDDLEETPDDLGDTPSKPDDDNSY